MRGGRAQMRRARERVHLLQARYLHLLPYFLDPGLLQSAACLLLACCGTLIHSFTSHSTELRAGKGGRLGARRRVTSSQTVQPITFRFSLPL